MKTRFIVIAILLLWTPWSHAQIKLGNSTSVTFATPDEARSILTVQDDFVQRMSPFDRAGRMKTVKAVSEKEYLEFASQNILPWKDNERKKIADAFKGILKSLEVYSLPFPKEVFIVKTTGLEEGGSAYTRANAIIFPKTEKYDLKRGGEFFDDLQFQFLLVEKRTNQSTVTPIYEGRKPKLASVQEVSGFFEQVGKNTELIIHPEEILASNFECLIMQDTGLPSPEIIGKLKEILMKRRANLSKS